MDFVRSDAFTLGLAVLLVSVAWTVLASESAPGQTEPADETPDYVSVRHLPQSTTLATLSNGLTVIVQENHAAPVATVRCYVKNTGSAFEGRHLGAGLSHVLEHVVAGGSTSRRTEDEIEQIIDRFGGATNAFTSTGLTAYFIDCPAKDTNTCIELIADSMQRIAFEPSEFERELKVVRRELSDGEANRGRVQFKLLNQTIYTTHPARHPIIGYLDVLNGTKNETITDFYRERYVPNNQVFVVVGDVNTDDVLTEIAKQWTGTPRKPETYIALPTEPEQLAPREATHEMDGSTYDVAIAWPTVKLSHPDLFALDVAAYILTQGDSSRLVRRLKHEEQLALSVRSASYTPSFVRGWFGVFLVATPDHWQPAADEIVRQVYRLRDELVSPEELDKAKKQKAAELVFGQQTVQQAADSLGRNFISTADPFFDEAYVAGIQQVTAEQVRQVARRYFLPQRLNRVVIAPPGGAPKSAQQEDAQDAGKIRAVKLSNGLRVLVRRDGRLPMVNMQAFVLGGSLVDTPDTAGRSNLLASMLNKGTGELTAQQIADYFDSVGGRMGFSAGRSTIYGTATVLQGDFDKAAELFAASFIRPNLPADEFDKVRTLALGAIARRRSDPRGEIQEAFSDNLPADSPYHLVQGGKEETIGSLTVDDLSALHGRLFVPQNMIVTVFGDIDPDAALAVVDRHFGTLETNPDFEPISFDRNNVIPDNVDRHIQTGKPTGMVMLGYSGTSVKNKQDYAALVLLDAITSGYGYPGGWLHNELRGAGLVYYVHALQITGPAPGYFVALSQMAPDKIQEVVERIQANFEKAKAGEISDDEFQRAKEMVIALHAQENTTISSQAQQAALDELYGLGYDYDQSFDERITAVTKDDVIAVAQKTLNNYVLVTSSPNPER